MIKKVISGGQTGVDRIGLEVAKALGIPTGGTAPMNYWTETGRDETLKDFGLVEGPAGYTDRTKLNVFESDGTLLFGDLTSPGSKMTIDFLKGYAKPYLENPTYSEIMEFCEKNNIQVVNIAGNRDSKLNESMRVDIYAVLEVAFKLINDL